MNNLNYKLLTNFKITLVTNMKLLLPVAGQSSRYPGLRPKGLLTLPDGKLMIERSLSGIDTEFIDEIVVIMLRDHESYINPNLLKEILENQTDNIPVKIFILEDKTYSQPSTICKYLESIDEVFEFFVKDSDNYFEFKPLPGNGVAYINLEKVDLVSAGSKSYISINNFDEIERIAEKKVISEKFCCGGYGFKSSKEFLDKYEEIGGDKNKNLYISHVIQKNLLDGITFHAYEAKSYESYGTLKEFQNYSQEVRTIFCDFDGVLVENSSKFANPPWQYNPIEANLNHLSRYLKNSSFSKVVITTSRPKSEEKKIKSFLKNHEINAHSVITDLPHSKRVLINDFSTSNKFPTSESINLPRNSDKLSDYL